MSSPIAFGPGYAVTGGGGTGGGSFSGGVSTVGNTAGTTGTVSNGILFVGGSNITLSESSGAGGATITWIAGAGGVPIATTVQSVLSANSVGTVTRYAAEDHAHEGIYAAGVSTGGNTLGATTVQPGRLVLAGGNNITLSVGTAAGALQTVTISGVNTVAQTVQPAINAAGVSTGGTTAGNTGTSSGMTLVFAGSGNITASQSTAAGQNTIWFSVPSQTVQANSDAIGVSNTGTTAGNTGTTNNLTIVFAGSGNITASQSTAAGQRTIWYSVPSQTVQANSDAFGVSNTGTTAGNTGTTNNATLVFAASGNITASQSTAAGQRTIWYSVPAQTNQSAIKGLGVSNTGTTAGNTGVSSGIDWVIAASGNITASESTAGGGPNTVWLSVPAQSNQSAIKGLGVSNTGNTAGNTGVVTGVDWVIAGSANITVNESTAAGGPNTIWITGPSPGAAQFSVGVSNLGNTAGSTGVTGTRIVFVGTNNITLSQSTDATGGTISISGPAAGGFSAGASNIGNTAGSTGVTGTRLVLVGTNDISLSQSTDANGGTVSFKGNEGTVNFYPNMLQEALTVLSTWGQSSVYVQPLEGAVQCPMVFDRAIHFITHNFSATNAASSQAFTLTFGVGLYTKNVSTLSLATSGSSAFQYTVTGSTSSQSYQGLRALTIPFNATLTPGDYWVGVVTATASAGNALAAGPSNMGFSQVATTYSGIFGAASNVSMQMLMGWGTWTNQSASVPSNILFADLRFAGGVIWRSRPGIYFANGTA